MTGRQTETERETEREKKRSVFTLYREDLTVKIYNTIHFKKA